MLQPRHELTVCSAAFTLSHNLFGVKARTREFHIRSRIYLLHFLLALFMHISRRSNLRLTFARYCPSLDWYRDLFLARHGKIIPFGKRADCHRPAAVHANRAEATIAVMRCAACLDQMKQGREAVPHCRLHFVRETKFQRPMRDRPYMETVYQCRDCGSVIMHTTDENEFPPYWWFTN